MAVGTVVNLWLHAPPVSLAFDVGLVQKVKKKGGFNGLRL